MPEFFRWEDIRDEWATWPEEVRTKTLFLEPHKAYPSYFLVNALNPLYIDTFKEVIGPYRAIHMLKVDKLYERADLEGYNNVVFIQTPDRMLDAIDHMDDPYPGELNIELFKFQLRGFNMLKDAKAQIWDWSTGTGKSVLAVAMAKYLLETGQIDKVVVASRKGKRTDWSREFAKIGSLECVVVEGTGKTAAEKRENRAAIYRNSDIFVINYQKFRFKYRYDRNLKEWVENSRDGDGEELLEALKGKRVFFVWDEMPVYLSSVGTLHYRGVSQILRKVKDWRQAMLSATPIENMPDGTYGCLKLLVKERVKNKATFQSEYAKTMSPFVAWKVDTWDTEKLKELGMRLSDITHKADKYNDPEIREQFPVEHWETIPIDMSQPHWDLYQWVEEYPGAEPLEKLLVQQTICNNPAWLPYLDSNLGREAYEEFKPSDQYARKIDNLKDLITTIDAKIVLFSMYTELGANRLAEYLADWKIPFVLYQGSEAQMQNAVDTFQFNEHVKVFLSSDVGSDSINLEAGSVVINFDLPWNHSRLVQRVNRINRITSQFDHIFYYTLMMVGTMEEDKVKRIETKQSYQDAVFDTDIGEAGEVLARAQREDLRKLLTGELLPADIG